jgi:hypothetical protein
MTREGVPPTTSPVLKTHRPLRARHRTNVRALIDAHDRRRRRVQPERRPVLATTGQTTLREPLQRVMPSASDEGSRAEAPRLACALRGGCRTNHSERRSINRPWDATMNGVSEKPKLWDTAPFHPAIHLDRSHHSRTQPISPVCATASRESGSASRIQLHDSWWRRIGSSGSGGGLGRSRKPVAWARVAPSLSKAPPVTFLPATRDLDPTTASHSLPLIALRSWSSVSPERRTVRSSAYARRRARHTFS